jgi:hypothetical protein
MKRDEQKGRIPGKRGAQSDKALSQIFTRQAFMRRYVGVSYIFFINLQITDLRFFDVDYAVQRYRHPMIISPKVMERRRKRRRTMWG